MPVELYIEPKTKVLLVGRLLFSRFASAPITTIRRNTHAYLSFLPYTLARHRRDVLGVACLHPADIAAVGASGSVPTPGLPHCGSSWAVGGRTPLVFTDEGAGSTPRYVPRTRSQHLQHPRQPEADVFGAVHLHPAGMAAVGASESVPTPGPPLCGSSWAVGGRIPLVFTDEGAGFTLRYVPRMFYDSHNILANHRRTSLELFACTLLVWQQSVRAGLYRPPVRHIVVQVGL
ncbi:hypothetical protein FRB93_011585 [Tulasnella sp. JGI-2019a]|nr:hypothetical protein FRB93_011585 [Tulasnella sp. JGI-2019a]